MSLSIIIPVYNTAQYLDKCLSSLLKIEPSIESNDIRVIFVNDGSTDKSAELLNDFERRHSFVNVIHQENQGLSCARNTGIRRLATEYFILLDSDDYIDGKILEKAYRKAAHNKLDLLAYRLKYVDQHGEISERPAQKVVSESVLSGYRVLRSDFQPSSACLYVYNTAFIRDNDLYFYPRICQQDVEISVRMMLCAKRVMFTNDFVYYYFKRSGSLSKPKSLEATYFYLGSSITVAEEIRKNINNEHPEDINDIITANYNSVIWNLVLDFVRNPERTEPRFKKESIERLRSTSLYPIKGKLKTPFQNIMRIVFNNPLFLRWLCAR
ncbi:MAG: glycosyltransferase [Chryseobacterium sp.]|nr:MAG: glycosyltransferase [Chryseobacterium sp.]